MNKAIEAKDIDVVVLCGGRGERLRSIVKDHPKPMAQINGRPFLDILMNYVAGFGFKRFILCIGYKGDLIRKYYRKSSLEIIFSEERKPLGTAGAIKNAESLIKSSPFLVLNGDSFCRLNLNEFIDFCISKKALFSVALVKAKQANGYGRVSLGSAQQVIEFDEKTETRRHSFINAGIYLFESIIFSLIPANKNFSLEYDLFPKIINREFYGYRSRARLIDIGTPKRFREAKVILKES